MTALDARRRLRTRRAARGVALHAAGPEAHAAPAVRERASATWERGPQPEVSVVIATYQRAALLPGLINALRQQHLDQSAFEVIVVDDASSDGTWEVLGELVESSSLRMLALRSDRNRGPGAARNLGAQRARSGYLAFTDDDCLPTASWLGSLLPALRAGATVVQGRVTPPEDDWAAAGPWDHTIWVRRPSPFFETCNVAYRRDRFEAVGGFSDADPLLRPGQGDHFGEDAELAWRVLAADGERSYADEALVHHRCVAAGYGDWLRGQRRVRGFPGLARRSPIFARWLRGRVFLSSRSASFDVGLASLALAAATRRPWPLVGTLPWGWIRGHDALRATRGDRRRAVPVLVQLALGDLVTLISLLQGSVRHRRVVL